MLFRPAASLAAENDATGSTLITWPRHTQLGWAGILRPAVSARAAPALSASATAAALAASRACHRPRRRSFEEIGYMSGLLGWAGSVTPRRCGGSRPDAFTAGVSP